MKIAVASQNKTSITDHAGRCRKFWIFEIQTNDIVSKTLLELKKEESFHEYHSSEMQQPHPLYHVDVLIAGSMGKDLVKRLETQNIEVILTQQQNIEEAIACYLKGALVSDGGHCHDHDHDHDHEH